MLRTAACALLLTLFAFEAQAGCLSGGPTSTCLGSQGNSYLSPPSQRLQAMPQADPRIAPRTLPGMRSGSSSVQRLRGPFPTVNGRVQRRPSLGPCQGASCGRQQRYFPQACRSPRCL